MSVKNATYRHLLFFSILSSFSTVLLYEFVLLLRTRSEPAWLHRLRHHTETLRRESFTTIVEKDLWNTDATRGKGSTLAGPGSTLNYTVLVREWLGRVIVEYDIQSIADLSCNELAWQMDIPGFFDLNTFTGYDIVPSVVDTAREKAANVSEFRVREGLHVPTFSFSLEDAVTGPPFPAHDLVILRDTLMHLPPIDALEAIARIEASGSKWVALTTFSSSGRNPNAFILPGNWYPVDLRQSPFFFSAPVNFTLEGYPGVDGYGSKKLALWRLPVLSHAPDKPLSIIV